MVFAPPTGPVMDGTNHRRGPWSQVEDDRLMRLVDLYGALNWVRISHDLGTRTPKQCRERYHQNLKPSLNHDPISPQEGVMIDQLVHTMGKRWAEIARRLPGRSDNAVKNWWNGSQNRRLRYDRRRTAPPGHGPHPYRNFGSMHHQQQQRRRRQEAKEQEQQQQQQQKQWRQHQHQHQHQHQQHQGAQQQQQLKKENPEEGQELLRLLQRIQPSAAPAPPSLLDRFNRPRMALGAPLSPVDHDYRPRFFVDRSEMPLLSPTSSSGSFSEVSSPRESHYGYSTLTPASSSPSPTSHPGGYPLSSLADLALSAAHRLTLPSAAPTGGRDILPPLFHWATSVRAFKSTAQSLRLPERSSLPSAPGSPVRLSPIAAGAAAAPAKDPRMDVASLLG